MSGMMMAAAAAQRRVSSVDPDAAAFIARFTTPPDSTRETATNNLFVALKAAGVYAKLDFLYVAKKAQDEQSAKLDLVRTTKVAAYVGATTWNADDGFKHAYNTAIVTDFKPSNGVNWTPNSAGLFAYFRNATTGAPDYGGIGAIIQAYGPNVSTDRVLIQVASGNAYSNINGDYSSADQEQWSNSNAGGDEVFYCLNRTAANLQSLYKGASALTSLTGANTYNAADRSLTTTEIHTYPGGAACTPRLYVLGGGAPLTTTEQSDLKTALDNYFAAL